MDGPCCRNISGWWHVLRSGNMCPEDLSQSVHLLNISEHTKIPSKSALIMDNTLWHLWPPISKKKIAQHCLRLRLQGNWSSPNWSRGSISAKCCLKWSLRLKIIWSRHPTSPHTGSNHLFLAWKTSVLKLPRMHMLHSGWRTFAFQVRNRWLLPVSNAGVWASHSSSAPKELCGYLFYSNLQFQLINRLGLCIKILYSFMLTDTMMTWSEK